MSKLEVAVDLVLFTIRDRRLHVLKEWRETGRKPAQLYRFKK